MIFASYHLQNVSRRRVGRGHMTIRQTTTVCDSWGEMNRVGARCPTLFGELLWSRQLALGQGAGFTSTVASSEISGECSPPPTAVFFAVPGTVGSTTTSTVAEPPPGRSPRTHWTALD